MDNYQKNSLLGQLEQKGLLKEDSHEGGYLPFGALSKGADTPINTEIQDESKEVKLVKKRLNELDNNIFQEEGFLNINDEELSPKEKIEKLSVLLKKIDKKIYMLEDMDDDILMDKLKKERSVLCDTIKLLSKQSFSLSDIKTEQGKINFNLLFKYVYASVLDLLPFIKKNYLVKKALNKLIMLNENAKELLENKIPYGEQEIRYNDFIAYLSCANIICAKLKKKI